MESGVTAARDDDAASLRRPFDSTTTPSALRGLKTTKTANNH